GDPAAQAGPGRDVVDAYARLVDYLLERVPAAAGPTAAGAPRCTARTGGIVPSPRWTRTRANLTSAVNLVARDPLGLGWSALLAVQHGHLALVVAFAGPGAGRRGVPDGGQALLGQLQADRPARPRPPVAAGLTDNWDD